VLQVRDKLNRITDEMSCYSLLIGTHVAGVAVLVDDAFGLAAGDRVGVGDETGLAPGKKANVTLIT
jgi:hypothetical protein